MFDIYIIKDISSDTEYVLEVFEYIYIDNPFKENVLAAARIV